jgi:O-antigen ligase
MNRATVVRPESPLRRGAEWITQHAPTAIVVFIAALFAAQQAVAPQRRAVKAAVMLGLIALMLRYDMVYSVYLFVLLFVFPSGISIGSTNTVLMTVIPALWLVRATSTRSTLIRKTPLDWAIIAFVLANVISLYAVSDAALLTKGLGMIWVVITAAAFFYCIVTFVDTEEKLMRMGKVMCIACALVMLTAVVELFAPGTTLIPGWISLSNKLGEGELSYRVQGLRVGGAFESHGMLADFGTQLILFMVFFALRARNPAEKAFWFLSAGMTFTAIMSTGNRGAMTGLGLAMVLALVFFRSRIGTARAFLLAGLAAIGLVAFDTFLSERTLAVSIFDRFAETEFEGVVPDTRTMTWKPALEMGLEKPFIGHGPYFDVGIGLTKRFWPHNGYLFYFVTLGLVGLAAFLWVVWGVYRQSRIWRVPAIRRTELGDFLALAQIWFFVLLLEQMRTDHQRDFIYPYIVWMCFGVVVTGSLIARRKLLAAREADQPGNRSMRSVTSMKS